MRLCSSDSLQPERRKLQFISDNKPRHKTWRERAGKLQALAKLTGQIHPDNAFLLFLEGGKDVYKGGFSERHLCGSCVGLARAAAHSDSKHASH